MDERLAARGHVGRSALEVPVHARPLAQRVLHHGGLQLIGRELETEGGRVELEPPWVRMREEEQPRWVVLPQPLSPLIGMQQRRIHAHGLLEPDSGHALFRLLGTMDHVHVIVGRVGRTSPQPRAAAPDVQHVDVTQPERRQQRRHRRGRREERVGRRAGLHVLGGRFHRRCWANRRGQYHNLRGVRGGGQSGCASELGQQRRLALPVSLPLEVDRELPLTARIGLARAQRPHGRCPIGRRPTAWREHRLLQSGDVALLDGAQIGGLPLGDHLRERLLAASRAHSKIAVIVVVDAQAVIVDV